MFVFCYSQHPQVWRLSGADFGPLYPQGAGPNVAREVPQVQRVQRPAQRQVFRPQWPGLLQGGLFQVSTHCRLARKIF